MPFFNFDEIEIALKSMEFDFKFEAENRVKRFIGMN